MCLFVVAATGVIGAGRIGRVHLDTLAGIPNVQPIILSDVVEPVLREVATKYNIPQVTTNADEVIKHKDVQAVWICSPSQFHADQIKKCAQAGMYCCVARHAFPFADSLLGVSQQESTCSAKNRSPPTSPEQLTQFASQRRQASN